MNYRFMTLNNIQENVELDQEECKIRIYGNVLGTTQDIISLWESIEKNYINIVACNKLFMDCIYKEEIGNIKPNPKTLITTSVFTYNITKSFMNLDEKYDIIDIVSPDDYPLITKISFNSPGFWEVIGQ